MTGKTLILLAAIGLASSVAAGVLDKTSSKVDFNKCTQLSAAAYVGIVHYELGTPQVLAMNMQDSAEAQGLLSQLVKAAVETPNKQGYAIRVARICSTLENR